MHARALPSLLQAVRIIPDPRTAHLVTHAWSTLLGLVACAMLCGVRSVRGQNAGILAALEILRWRPGPAPSPEVIRIHPEKVHSCGLES